MSVVGGVLNMPVDKPRRGCRVESTWQASSAKICANIKTPDTPTPGSIFAFYVITSHAAKSQGAPWWEIDYEFMGKDVNSAWLSKFDGGKNDIWSGLYVDSPAHNEWNDYCIDWDIPNKCVKWITNGVVVRSLPMPPNWNQPLHAVLSHWVGKEGKSAGWAGGSSVPGKRVAMVRKIRWSIRD